MLHLLVRAVSLQISVMIENTVLKWNRIFYYPELLFGEFMII